MTVVGRIEQLTGGGGGGGRQPYETVTHVIQYRAPAARVELPDVGCCYEHVKTGRRYLVTSVVLGTETNSLEVVYRPLYDVDLPEGVTGFHRPLGMFMDGRFRRIRG